MKILTMLILLTMLWYVVYNERVYNTIPCPDNKQGCMTVHYGMSTDIHHYKRFNTYEDASRFADILSDSSKYWGIKIIEVPKSTYFYKQR